MKETVFVFLLFLSFPCSAQIAEFAHLYDVDMNETLPNITQLKREYKTANSNYDWRYNYSWHMPVAFDASFKQDITHFGTVEKRIGNPDEDALYRDLQRLPKAYYPYIGPVLHTVPGLSGKILDLPGIKETKNQFPTRIASKLEGIKNLEFLSPALYIYLMPQIWGEDTQSLEFPQPPSLLPNDPPVRIKPEFLKKLHAKVPVSDYAFGKHPNTNPGITPRHFNADINTPLSAADVEAFVATFDGLLEFQKSGFNNLQLANLSGLITYWDEKNGVDRQVSFLKGVVNPCQTIVRKVKWAGLRSEFQKAIGAQGFSPEDWAYTCDKTLKAFRVASANNAYLTALNMLRKGYVYRMINEYAYYTPEERMTHKYFLEASLQLFQSSPGDIEAVRPYQQQLRRRLPEFDSAFLGTPLVLP